MRLLLTTHTVRPHIVAVMVASYLLTGCSPAKRLASIGEMPSLSPITNPWDEPGYKPLSQPLPPSQPFERQHNSLWRTGSRGFFKDLRASHVGDILTVIIGINDSGNFSDQTQRQRANSDNVNIGNLFGFQNQFKNLLPASIQEKLPNIYSTDSKLSNQGTGTIHRSEAVNLRLAAIISQVLPNGNMVLIGRQEVRVNYELRELELMGIIRPEDITPTNTINYDQIAEARISYSGRGQLIDVQQPRYGSQLLDILLPF